MEYFCNEDDDLWNLPDRELAMMASRSCPNWGFVPRKMLWIAL
jgi:hypothetical protein